MSMRSTYRKIAKENGVTVAEVKQEMQAAINTAYENPPNDGITRAYQNRVPRKDNIPTPNEFICYTASKIRIKKIKAVNESNSMDDLVFFERRHSLWQLTHQMSIELCTACIPAISTLSG